VEKETQQADERGKVAGSSTTGSTRTSSSASTRRAVRAEPVLGGLSEADLAKDTPYNNRIHKGLPPTPIANPGDRVAAGRGGAGEGAVALLRARREPPGHHLFTDDRDVFNTAKAKCQAAHLC
jgi:cell division protein YceG involved in septum cleavage